MTKPVSIKTLVEVGMVKAAKAFLDIETQLSPENLCCDGELSNSEVAARYQNLMAQWDRLEKKNCIRVSHNVGFDDYKAVMEAEKKQGK